MAINLVVSEDKLLHAPHCTCDKVGARELNDVSSLADLVTKVYGPDTETDYDALDTCLAEIDVAPCLLLEAVTSLPTYSI
jgi:hypothetical protein